MRCRLRTRGSCPRVRLNRPVEPSFDRITVIESLSARRLAYAVAALLAVLAGGTVAFHQSLNETWMQSAYRTVVTISLAGLDTVPKNDSSRAVSIVLVLVGLTIFAYIATVLVEGISQGVFTGAFAERRRRRTIEHLSDHYIICGYGRVGRRIAAEFLEEGVRFVVLDFSPEAIEAARERNLLFVEGSGIEDEDLEAAGLSRATRARRLVRLGRRQPLHHALGPQRAARPADRRPRLRRGRGQEAAPGRRRPRRAAVLDRRQGDGEARPAAAGGRVPRHRLDERRPGAAVRGDRGQASPAARPASRSASCASASRPAR